MRCCQVVVFCPIPLGAEQGRARRHHVSRCARMGVSAGLRSVCRGGGTGAIGVGGLTGAAAGPCSGATVMTVGGSGCEEDGGPDGIAVAVFLSAPACARRRAGWCVRRTQCRQAVVKLRHGHELAERDRLDVEELPGKVAASGPGSQQAPGRRQIATLRPRRGGQLHRVIDLPIQHLRLMLDLIHIQAGPAGQHHGQTGERPDHAAAAPAPWPSSPTRTMACSRALRARIVANFRVARTPGACGEETKIRRRARAQPARVAARRRGLAGPGGGHHEMLDDPILQRMEGHHDQPSAGAQQYAALSQRPFDGRQLGCSPGCATPGKLRHRRINTRSVGAGGTARMVSARREVVLQLGQLCAPRRSRARSVGRRVPRRR